MAGTVGEVTNSLVFIPHYSNVVGFSYFDRRDGVDSVGCKQKQIYIRSDALILIVPIIISIVAIYR